MSSLAGKVIVITGSSAGIGAACGIEFAKHGAKLVLTGRNKTTLANVAEQCQNNGALEIHQVVADMTKEDDIRSLVKETIDKYGTIHILINNAGGSPPPSDADPPLAAGDLNLTGHTADFDYQYKLCVRVPWQLSGLFVDELIKNKGNIINISSIAGQTTSPDWYAYGTMKAAMNYLSRCMATELGMQGVRVNCIMPGAVATDVFRYRPVAEHAEIWQALANKFHLLEQKVMDSSDIAKSVVFLASDDASRITGVVLPVDCGAMLASPAYDFTVGNSEKA